MFVGIIKNIAGFIKNLNLSKKDVAIIIVVCILGYLVLSRNSYKAEANRLQTSLTLMEDELTVERNKARISDNKEYVESLQKKLKDQDKLVADLYEELNSEKNNPVSRTDIVEELGDINNTKTSCDALAGMGYPICIQ